MLSKSSKIKENEAKQKRKTEKIGARAMHLIRVTHMRGKKAELTRWSS